MPDPTSPTYDPHPHPAITRASTSRPDPLHLITSSSGTVRQEQRTRADGHLRLLLETIKDVHVHHPRLVRRGQSQHQDDTIASIRMSPDQLPLPMVVGSERVVSVDILQVEHRDVEQELGLVRGGLGTAVQVVAAVAVVTE